MVKIKTKAEISLMRGSGRISAHALKKMIKSIKAGISGLDLEKIAEDEIKRLGGQSAFKKVPGYKWTTCITLNDQVVHGIPTDIEIKKGDVVSVDLGAIYKGWYSDCAWSVVVDGDNEKKMFVNVGQQALWEGIKKAVAGNKIGDISSAIQSRVEGAGYSVVRTLVGHGVGKNLHEDPEVPGFGVKGQGLTLQKGMSLAIEVIYTKGKPDVVTDSDGWTILSEDGSLGGLFEMTVIVGKKNGSSNHGSSNKAEVLTDWRKV